VYRHRYFDLLLHDDAELEALIRSPIVERTTLHEWPLSFVQRVATSDGRRLIYKSQSGPSVEPDFYASCVSDLLVGARTVYRDAGYACMLLDHAKGTLARDLDLMESEILRIGPEVMEQVASIGGSPPVYLDVGTEERWRELVSGTCHALRALIGEEKLPSVSDGLVGELEHWALDSQTLGAIRGRPGLVHGDLTGENLFLRPGGYHLIDWQFPKIAPRDLDLATLLESLGVDPRRHVSVATVRVMWLLRACWLTECAVRWFPAGTPHYDVQIAHLASLIAEADDE
jgi:Phosphotransferase enzyme family